MSSCHRALCRPRAHAVPLGRRAFVKLATAAAGTGLVLGWAPGLAWAGSAQALLLTCIDYRFLDPTAAFMHGKGLDKKYDQVILAGASLGVVSEKFEAWHRTFWDHVDVAIELHGIHEVIVVDHRDCGAYKLALGPESMATPELETAVHERTLKTFGQLVRTRYPGLGISAYLMALDGTVQQFEV